MNRSRRMGLRNRRMQFGVRAILLIMTLIAVWFGWRINRVRTWKAALEAVRQPRNGLTSAHVKFREKTVESWPSWLDWALWQDEGSRAVQIIWQFDVTNEDLEKLRPLNQIKTLSITHSQKVTDEGLVHLRDMSGLEMLTLWSVAVRGDGLRHCAELNNLKTLNVMECPLTDAGLGYLAAIPNLAKLDVSHTEITDGGVAELTKLRKLRYLNLKSTDVTRSAVERLQEALPNCEIDW